MGDQNSDKLRAFLEKRKKEKSAVSENTENKPVNPVSEMATESDLEPQNPSQTQEDSPPIETLLSSESIEMESEPATEPQVTEEVALETESPAGQQEKPAQVSSSPIQNQTPIEPTMEPMGELEEQSQLKAYLNQRRKTVKGDDEDDSDDPYSGDGIAKKNLRHLQKYLEREDIADVKEIVINRPGEVGIEYADGHWEWAKDPDMTQANLDEIARTLANKSGQLFHSGNPILSVKMPGGHRVQVVAGFNSPSGFVFSMRLQRKEKFGLMDFKMSDEEREKIQSLVREQKTILISGGTGTGKTSFMNALIPAIPEDERLVTMEDVPELRIPHRNWAQLVFSGSDTATGDQGVIELLNACLRLRPDRIILGEIRKENAFAFCSAINTGHEGSMATIHANNPKMAIDAVINRVMMNGDLPDSAMQVLRRQLAHDIYAVVQLTRIQHGVGAKLTVLSDQEDF
jgi:type IV secretion system protein VirB11